MSTIFFMVRFFNRPDYANDFVQGRIHFSRLSFFKRLEADEVLGRADRHEGTTSWLQPEQVRMVINGRDISANLAGPLQIQLNWLNHLHVHCIHAVHSGRIEVVSAVKGSIEELRRELMISTRCLSLGKYAVIVQDVRQFIDRMRAAARLRDLQIASRLVKYYDPDTFHGEFDGVEAAFHKRAEFAYQREYRIVLNTGTTDDSSLVLDIGDISDITLQMDAEELNGPRLLGGQLEIAPIEPTGNE